MPSHRRDGRSAVADPSDRACTRGRRKVYWRIHHPRPSGVARTRHALLSNKAKYALKALIQLARDYDKGPILISELCAREGLPQKFLELILLELKNKGMLQSKKGKGGGYSLAKHPASITFGAIISALDGPLSWVPCVGEGSTSTCAECRDQKTCSIRMAMREVRDRTTEILEGMTLLEAIRREDEAAASARRVQMYDI